ncbi:MAG: shikimate dehydrogenase [Deltaproteobacteria bacterium]|nr:shikimate dehydrogenase [Deltaproteobacteria bacterium]MBW2401636.1 shikimate dehydrogenase [Deltaproteobacteria bacterium]MBW2664645.1 shikimate dehydrogenase [Deltaproteobacteria bacterium]
MARPKQEVRRISARTELCGIVLHPAGHTRSPAMHNAAFAEAGIDAVYLAFDVHPDQLEDALVAARALGVRQLAVSLPHKEAVLAHLDEVETCARAIGAVNTVTLRDGRLVGTNTDWIGAVHALERNVELAGARVIVLGAGGTARALVYGLVERGALVTVLNRTPERAQVLADDLGAVGAGPLRDLAQTPHEVLVNTTSVGLRTDDSPVPAADLLAESLVMDVVYDPEETRLLRDARTRGASTITGKWMLVYQAAEQFRDWTGREAPLDVMASAFDEAGGS